MSNKYLNWIKDAYQDYQEQKKEENEKVEKDVLESWKFEDNNAQMNASDSVEFTYNYKYGTSFHKNIVDRLKSYKDVSSPGATNKRATAMIWLSFVGKLLSIYMSYISILYLYEHGLKTQLNVNVWIEASFIFGLSIVWEWLSSSELKSIFNATENKLTRFMGLFVGLSLSIGSLYLHIYYQDLQGKINHQQNSSKVLGVDTAATLAVKSKISNVEMQIKAEEEKIKIHSSIISEQREDFNKQIKELEEKRDFYKKVISDIESKKRKTWKRGGVVYTKLNGKSTRVASIPGYIRYRDKKIAEISSKKASLSVPSSPRLNTLANQKDKLTEELEKAYNASKKQMDVVSDSSGHAGLLFQIFITLLAKIDVYGYFLLRANIKNSVLEKMHDIIDEFNAVNQLQGVFDQFSRMNTQTLRAIGHSALGVNNEISAVNRSIVANGNRYLKSNKRLIMALEDKTDEGVINASYRKTGDSRIDIGKDMEKILTDYIRSLGYSQTVVLNDEIEEGEVNGNVIYINPKHTEEDMVKILRHELGHVEAKTHKHDENFKKGVEAVVAKEKEVEKPIFNVKRKNYQFETDRAVEILSAYALNQELVFTTSEIEYFKNAGVWSGKLDVRDYMHLMDVLDV